MKRRNKDINKAETQNQDQAQHKVAIALSEGKSSPKSKGLAALWAIELSLDLFEFLNDHWQLVLQENKESEDERVVKIPINPTQIKMPTPQKAPGTKEASKHVLAVVGIGT